MDYARLTTPPVVTADPAAVASAVQQLLDTEAIRNLLAIYSIARDDNDIESLLACFADDGAFVNSGVRYEGHPALRAHYVGNMDRYRTTLHTTHTQLVDFTTADAADGVVTGHAELSFGDDLMLAAYRYADRYARVAGRWVIRERRLRFMYAAPFDEMATSFTTPLRMRWRGREPYAADFPESSPTWTTYANDQPPVTG
jgi:ketosteroid isomerase-like protein